MSIDPTTIDPAHPYVIRSLRRLEYPTNRGYLRAEVGDVLPTTEHSMTLVRLGLAEEVHGALADAADGAPLPSAEEAAAFALPDDPAEWPGAVSLLPPPADDEEPEPVDLDPQLVDLSDEEIAGLSPEQLRDEVALRQIETPDRRLPTLRAALREQMSRYTVQDDAPALTTEETPNG